MGDMVNGWEAKASALEKIKSRLSNELEDMHVQMEKVTCLCLLHVCSYVTD